MVDAIFGEPKLAEVYDAVDDDRRDLDAYVDLVDELGARSVLDIGCGTGNASAGSLARASRSLASTRRSPRSPSPDGSRALGAFGGSPATRQSSRSFRSTWRP